jgi:3-deoxy-D-manno-octulosonic-acid transferase
LADFYALGDVAFVGGSLIPRGGHNMLEPVLRGVPVLFGPHVMNFRAAASLVLSHGLGSQAKDEEELEKVLRFWLQTDNRNGFSPRIEAALAPHRGAAARLAQNVAAALRRN